MAAHLVVQVHYPVAAVAVAPLPVPAVMVPAAEFVLFFTDRDFLQINTKIKKNDRISQFCRSV
jgi:hypothetical protein